MEVPNSKQNTMKVIIFFDGVCHLCNGWVDFILRRDKQRTFFLAPLQGETAKSYLSESDRRDLNSVVLWQDGKKYYRSEAVLRIFMQLRGFRWVLALTWIPRKMRDGAYAMVANNRYRWFGKAKVCRLPTEAEVERLLN